MTISTPLFAPCEIGLPQVSDHWYLTRASDHAAHQLFQRHYSYQPGRWKRNTTHRFGPGETMVLLTAQADALFVWRRERYRLDSQQGINCAVFRNETAISSSLLIGEASELALKRWPGERLFTFINPSRIKSTNPGYCFLCAGWRRCGTSKGGLVILEYV